jgi:hypothetical protein
VLELLKLGSQSEDGSRGYMHSIIVQAGHKLAG